MHLLITGGAGFIGTHLRGAAEAGGCDIDCVDNFADSCYPSSYKERRTTGADMVRASCMDMEIGDDVDCIVHLAAHPGVKFSTENPTECVRQNVLAFTAVLEKAVARGIPVVFASSSSVYGTCEGKVSEDAPKKPQSVYANTKVAMEEIAQTMCRMHPTLTAVALRFFTVIGSQGRPDMAYYTFARRISDKEMVTVFKRPDGRSMQRTFTDVRDITSGILNAVAFATDAETLGFHAFNLGSESPHTVGEMLDCIATHLGPPFESVERTAPCYDALCTYADISKARAILGFDPQYDLNKSVEAFCDWFKREELSRRELHLFICWSERRREEAEAILKTHEAAGSIRVIRSATFDVSDDKAAFSEEFFGKPILDRRGSTPFTAWLLSVRAPVYESRRTSRGRRNLCTDTFDVKREAEAAGIRSHASYDVREMWAQVACIGRYADAARLVSKPSFLSYCGIGEALSRAGIGYVFKGPRILRVSNLGAACSVLGGVQSKRSTEIQINFHPVESISKLDLDITENAREIATSVLDSRLGYRVPRESDRWPYIFLP